VICIPSIAASALDRSRSRSLYVLGTSQAAGTGCIPAFVDEGLGPGWGHDGTHTQTPSWPRFPHRNEGLQFGEASQFVVAYRGGFSCVPTYPRQSMVQELSFPGPAVKHPTLEQKTALLPQVEPTKTIGFTTLRRVFSAKTRVCISISLPAIRGLVVTPMSPTMQSSGGARQTTSCANSFIRSRASRSATRSCAGAKQNGGLRSNDTQTSAGKWLPPREHSCAGWNPGEAAQ
jgi:hypothetical protein